MRKKDLHPQALPLVDHGQEIPLSLVAFDLVHAGIW